MGQLRLVQVLSPVAFAVVALLWISDAISQPVFITLVIIETALSMGLSLWLLRRNRATPGDTGDLQGRIDEEIGQPD
jgi:hypothetical protein